jgi:hypothetical protein
MRNDLQEGHQQSDWEGRKGVPLRAVVASGWDKRDLWDNYIWLKEVKLYPNKDKKKASD